MDTEKSPRKSPKTSMHNSSVRPSKAYTPSEHCEAPEKDSRDAAREERRSSESMAPRHAEMKEEEEEEEPSSPVINLVTKQSKRDSIDKGLPYIMAAEGMKPRKSTGGGTESDSNAIRRRSISRRSLFSQQSCDSENTGNSSRSRPSTWRLLAPVRRYSSTSSISTISYDGNDKKPKHQKAIVAGFFGSISKAFNKRRRRGSRGSRGSDTSVSLDGVHDIDSENPHWINGGLDSSAHGDGSAMPGRGIATGLGSNVSLRDLSSGRLEETTNRQLEFFLRSLRSLALQYLELDADGSNKLGLHFLQRASQGGVTIYTSPVVRSRLLAVRTKFIIRKNKKKVRELLLDDEFMKEWDENFDYAEHLQRVDGVSKMRRLVYKSSSSSSSSAVVAPPEPTRRNLKVPPLNLSVGQVPMFSPDRVNEVTNSPFVGKSSPGDADEHIDVEADASEKPNADAGMDILRASASTQKSPAMSALTISSTSSQGPPLTLPRDYVVCSTYFDMPDGSIVVATRSVPDVYKAEVEGYIRGIIYVSAYHIQSNSDNTACNVTCVIHADVRDNRPPSLIHLLRTTAPLKKKLAFIELAEGMGS